MINLMPDEAKRELRAARTNVIIVRYMCIIFIACLFLLLILFGSYFLLGQTRDSAQRLITTNDTKAEVYSATKSQVDNLSASLSQARGILDQEVLYSNVLVNFAQLMPAGTVLNKLTLDTTSFGATPLNLTVYAKTTNDAVILKDRFQNSPLFSNVNFQTISDTTGGIAGYPVSVTMTLTLNKAAAK